MLLKSVEEKRTKTTTVAEEEQTISSLFVTNGEQEIDSKENKKEGESPLILDLPSSPLLSPATSPQQQKPTPTETSTTEELPIQLDSPKIDISPEKAEPKDQPPKSKPKRRLLHSIFQVPSSP